MVVASCKGQRGLARLVIGFTALIAACDASDESDDEATAGDESVGDEEGGDAVDPPALEALGCIPDEDSSALAAADAEPRGGIDPVNTLTSVARPALLEGDFAALTAGITPLTTGNNPSQLVLTGPSAFPVLTGDNNRIYAAASRVGLGKVVAFGHEGYMNGTAKSGGWLAMLKNSIAWTTSQQAPVIGITSNLTALQTTLQSAGYTVKVVTPSTLAGIHVYINGWNFSKPTLYTQAEYEAIRSFVANGGGLIVGGYAWGYAYPPGTTVLDYPLNPMLQSAGILITTDYLPKTDFPIPTSAPPELLNAFVALDSFTQYAQGTLNLSVADQEIGVKAIETALKRVPILAKDFYQKAGAFTEAAAPMNITANTPFLPEGKLVAKNAALVLEKLYKELPAAEITAYPAAADFPGAVSKDIPRVSVVAVIDGTYAGIDSRYYNANFGNGSGVVWRTTGAYAAPGEVIKVKIPPALATAGINVQIGAHSDVLFSKTKWVRFPSIIRSQPLNAAEVSAASAFGGPVYITLPAGKALGEFSVTVENVVRAPVYVHGETTPAEWLTIRDYPAPWAELVTDKIIVMPPSSSIKMLADPAPAMDEWEQILDAEADLGAIPHDRPRPERYLIDRDISAGAQHAGYPVMTTFADATNVVNAAYISTKAWGYYHELGHNHQWTGWSIPGTGEVTNNLFSVYVAEFLFGVPRAMAHSALLPASRAGRVKTYAAQGKLFSAWTSDPWLALETFLRLQESFGWQLIKDTFGEIQALSKAQTPSTDQTKIDLLTLTLAQKSGKNLGPYFKTGWGFPMTQSVLDQMAALPAWYHHCPAAVVSGTFGQVQGPWTLASSVDANWFVFTATASDIGKKVRVVTSAGDPGTDTVVEVLTGECNVLTSLGGPSGDAGIHENWLSTPIAAAGKIFVRVTYSNKGYVDDLYNLTVTLE